MKPIQTEEKTFLFPSCVECHHDQSILTQNLFTSIFQKNIFPSIFILRCFETCYYFLVKIFNRISIDVDLLSFETRYGNILKFIIQFPYHSDKIKHRNGIVVYTCLSNLCGVSSK